MAGKTTEVKYKIDIDAANASKTLGGLESSIDKLKELREGEQIGSQAFDELSRSIQKAEGKVKDVELQFESLDIEQKLTAGSDAVVGLAGSFVAVEGAMALMGVQSEELEEALVKVAGAMAMTQGLRDLANGAIAFRKLAVSQGIAAKAQKVLNTAMKSNPIALIVIAVAALLLGLKKLYDWWSDASSESVKNLEKESAKTKQLIKDTEDLAKAIEDRAKRQKVASDAILSMIDDELALAQARNATESELIAIEEKGNKARLDANKQEATNTLAQINQNEKIIAQAKIEVEAIKDRIEVVALEGKAATAEAKQWQEKIDLIKATEQANKELTDEFTTQSFARRSLQNAEEVFTITSEKRINDERQKNHEDSQKRHAEWLKTTEGEMSILREKGVIEVRISQEVKDELLRVASERDEKELDAAKAHTSAIGDAFASFQEKQLAAKQEEIDKANELNDKRQEGLNNATQTIGILNNLNDTFVKDEQAREKIKKSLAVAQIAVDTARGISAAIASGAAVPFPGNIPAIISGVAAVVSGIAQASSILGSSASTPDISGAISGGGQGAGIDQISNTSTIVDQNQQNIAQQVVVLESDITGAQTNVAGIDQAATY